MEHSTTSQWNVARRLSGTSPRRLKQVSDKTPNDISVVRHQDVSVVCIHDVLLVRLQDVFCNSQMKNPMTSLWYVSTMLRSYVVVTPCLYYGLHYVFKLVCHDLHMVDFHASLKYQIKHQIFLVPTRRESIGVVWIINQQNFYYIKKGFIHQQYL